MNISNAEFPSSMGTIRSDFSTSNIKLIKSASTSTCCANENQKKESRRNQSQKKDDFNYKKFIVEPSLNLEYSISNSHQENAQNNLFYYKSKHFSDCDYISDLEQFAQIKLPNQIPYVQENNYGFHSHSGLDSIIVNQKNNNSAINFALINESQKMDENNFETNSTNSQVPDTGTDSSQINDSQQDDLINISEHTGSEISSINTQAELLENSCNQQSKESPNPEDDIEQIVDEKSNNNNNTGSSSDSTDSVNLSSISPESQIRRIEISEKPIRRSSSLKINKESSSTLAQKKIVRFADVMGLDLADVRTFLDELPLVPKSAYDDLENEEIISESPPTFFGSMGTEIKSLVPTFKSPSLLGNFLERIRDNFVCLETITVLDSPVCQIVGTVRVRNIDFHKSVFVRYTMDNWKSYLEVRASYVSDSCDGFSDKFTFIIYIYTLSVGQKIELAVRYHCGGSIYWDNNCSQNYVFQCVQSSPAMPSYFQCFSPSNDTCHSFY